MRPSHRTRWAAPALAALALLAVPSAAPAATSGRAVAVLAAPSGPTAQASAATAVAARAGARRVDGVPRFRVASFAPRPGQSLADLVRALRADPRVVSARPELRFEPRYTPDDPALRTPETASGTPPDTTVQWTVAREDLPRAWDLSRGDGATVAVIDTGVWTGHPEIGPKVVRRIDQGGGDPNLDASGHGTHVASQACAATDDGLGMTGTGFNCRLIVERSDLFETSIANSIIDAVDHGADVINMSFGSDDDRPPASAVTNAIAYAWQRGVVMVAAASNEPVEEQGYPANVLQPTGTAADPAAGRGLVVTAATYDEQPRGGFGSQVSLAAYGWFFAPGRGGPRGLFGAFPNDRTEAETGNPFTIPPRPGCGCRTTFGGSDDYAYQRGTSMAAPRVAGMAALVKSLNPDLTAREIVRLMKETARNNVWQPQLGWGLVDPATALEAARQIDKTPPVSRLRAPSRSGTRRFTLRWSGRDPRRPHLFPSGIRRYEVYASSNGGRYRLIARTSATSLRFTGRAGRRYSFYTRALDRAGNRETVPARADATTRVAP